MVRERKTGEQWLTALTKAERWYEKYPTIDPRIWVAVAHLAFKPGQSQRDYRVLLGDQREIDRALAGESIYTVNFVSIARVRHQLYANAAHAGIELPARLTIAEDEPGYADWRREIDAYREAAGARIAKTKPLTPA